jgi:hypothetical protein
MQYAIVFLVGLSWGKWIIENKSKSRRRLLSLYTAIGFGLGLLLLKMLPLSELINGQTNRWPPSLAFIFIGLIFSYIISSIVEIEVPQTGKFSAVTRKLAYFGRYPFSFYIIHIILLQFYSLLWGHKYPDYVYTIIGFAGSSAVVYLTAKILNSIGRSRKIKLNKFLLIILALALSFTGALRAGVYIDERSGEPSSDTSKDQPDKTEEAAFWWDDNYSWNRQVTVENNSGNDISTEQRLSFNFDHQALVTAGSSLANGADIHLIYVEDSENDQYEDLPIKLAAVNSKETQIIFQPAADIGKGRKDDKYYLYYGNDQAQNYKTMDDSVSAEPPAAIEVEISQEIGHPNFLSVNREWYLKGNEVLKEESNIDIRFVPENRDGSAVYKYSLIGTETNGVLVKSFSNFTADLDTSELDPGTYKMQISSTDSKVKSNIITFKVSYPLYVLWTMDWEGYDCNQTHLDSINALSSKHNIPITQFYNPRIYVGLSKSRQDYLDNWIKARQKNSGDEVQLHLHMFHDMVQATGVEVKREPKWTNYTDGKDVLATAYTTQEMEKILNWSKTKFAARGFQTPTAFRAGAWYADESTLQALENTGFLIDSSGRQKYAWGINNVPGYWDLQTTTRPYKPSKADQNVTGSPSFNLYEFPNNGADSWTYSADQLINRFKDNYKDSPMLDKQAITYISHPHAFNVDQPKLEALFTYIDSRTFRADSGPVKYVTMSQAYAGWAD